MPNITITLTDAEYQSLENIAVDPTSWVQKAAKGRAKSAGDIIVRMYTERALSEGIQIPTTRDAVIADAYTRGWAKTVVQQNAEFDAQLAARVEAEITPEQTGQ